MIDNILNIQIIKYKINTKLFHLGKEKCSQQIEHIFELKIFNIVGLQ